MNEKLIELYGQGVELYKNLEFDAQENPAWAENSIIDTETRSEHFNWLAQLFETLRRSTNGSFVADKIRRNIDIDTNPGDYWLNDNPSRLFCGVVLKHKEIVLNELEKYIGTSPKANSTSFNISKSPKASRSSIKKTLNRENDNLNNQLSKYDGKIRFDAEASILTFGNKTCEIPDETLEYYICKFTFSNRRKPAKEDDILEMTVKSQDSQRAVYDAMLRVNKKAREQLGIDKLLFYKAAKIRIVKNYQ